MTQPSGSFFSFPNDIGHEPLDSRTLKLALQSFQGARFSAIAPASTAKGEIDAIHMFQTGKSFRVWLLTAVALSWAGALGADTDAIAGAWAWTGHFQATVVPEGHPGFSAPYSGLNSLGDTPALDTSLTSTLFLGLRLVPGLELYCNPELQAGSGFNGTTGLADFPNGEIYRVSSPYPALNLSRLFLQWVVGFGGPKENVEDGANQIAGVRDVSRLTLVAGKFSLNDYFDDNTYSHDPRSQFLNWALMDLGAWDYAADTHGYTEGIYAEFNQGSWALRFAEVMEPKQANGETMDLDVLHAHSENLELETRWWRQGRPGKLRILAFCNHADMGSYRATLDSPSDGMNIADTQTVGSIKYGFGLNLEQLVAKNLGFFSRLSWNDGHTETWAFTEIDRSGSMGFQWNGDAWGRSSDHVGLAYIISGLSPEHEEYLAAGGYGFIIGDGALDYAPEQVVEAYYSLGIVKGLTVSPDYQYFRNPAYNQDRGPVHVFSMRVHLEL